MGGGNQPHIDLEFLAGADWGEGAFLQDTQQSHLHIRRQLTELIQKQRAAMGLLEHSGPIGNRSGECALLVAKQGGVDQLRHNGPAVHRHKGRNRTWAGIVNGAGKQLFAGTGFTVNQYWDLLRRGICACALSVSMRSLCVTMLSKAASTGASSPAS